MNIALLLLVNSYSAVAPTVNSVGFLCTSQGAKIACSGAIKGIGNWLGILILVLIIIAIVSVWKVFRKAGMPGWSAIVPIYNTIVLLRIVSKPEWWVILTFIPFVNIVVMAIVLYRLAKVFGKNTAFTIGLMILPPIFYTILAFDGSQYRSYIKVSKTSDPIV